MVHTDPIDLATYRGAEGDGYRGVGEELRAARESSGLGLEHISSALRIRRQHLEAIEDGRFEDLPGRVYALGFVRGYAEFLCLDADIVVNRYREEIAGPAPDAELNFPEPPAQQWRPNFLPFALALVIAGGAYAVWNYLETRDEVPRELMAELPETLANELGIDKAADDASADPQAEKLPEPGVGALTERALAEAEPTEPMIANKATMPVESGNAWQSANRDVIAPLPQMPEPKVAVVPTVTSTVTSTVTPTVTAIADAIPRLDFLPAVEEAEIDPALATTSTVARVENPAVSTLVEDGPPPPPPTAPVAEYEPRVYGQGNEDARVVVRARTDSWVQVQGADNDLLLTRILHPGDKFLVPDRSDLVLSTGNAGGLEIFVDGALMPSLGGAGDVLRDVSLDPRALTTGRAIHNR